MEAVMEKGELGPSPLEQLKQREVTIVRSIERLQLAYLMGGCSDYSIEHDIDQLDRELEDVRHERLMYEMPEIYGPQ
jgi:hypothetical protein